jgi:hypothetical protein
MERRAIWKEMRSKTIAAFDWRSWSWADLQVMEERVIAA